MYNYRAAHPESQSVPPLPESESSQPEWSWAFSFPKSLFLPDRFSRPQRHLEVLAAADSLENGVYHVAIRFHLQSALFRLSLCQIADYRIRQALCLPLRRHPCPGFQAVERGKTANRWSSKAPARQTWLMKEFGQKVYQDYIYINFDSNSRMSELFSSDLNPQRLILGLELYSGKKTFPRTLSSFSMKSGRFQEPFPAWSILRECTSIPYHQCRISPWNRASPRHFFSGRKNRFSKAVPSFLSGISDDSGTGTICWSSIIL